MSRNRQAHLSSSSASLSPDTEALCGFRSTDTSDQAPVDESSHSQQEHIRAKRAAFALKHPNDGGATPLDLDSLTLISPLREVSSQESLGHDSTSEDSPRTSSNDASSIFSASSGSLDSLGKHICRQSTESEARPSGKIPSNIKYEDNNKTKTKRCCLDTSALGFSYSNVYTSGSTHGRKRIGGPNGLPGACLLM